MNYAQGFNFPFKGAFSREKFCQLSICGDTLGLKYEPLTYLTFFWSFLKKLRFLKN
jgi:hypothetical protein